MPLASSSLFLLKMFSAETSWIRKNFCAVTTVTKNFCDHSFRAHKKNSTKPNINYRINYLSVIFLCYNDLMRLYLSSFKIGNHPEKLVELTGSSKNAVVILNALDYKPESRTKFLGS